MPDNCLFCLIAARTIPAHILYEDDLVLAFLDINPIRPGHTQIVTRAHIPYFEDMPADTATRIVTVGQRFAAAMKRLYPVPRVGFAFIGSDIAHVHAHVVPMHHPNDITSRRYFEGEESFTLRALPRPTDAEMAQVATDLRQALG